MAHRLFKAIPSFSFGDIQAEGRTKTVAKKACMDKAEKALTGSYKPIVIRHEDWMVIGWREPYGWCSAIAGPDRVGDTIPKCGVSMGSLEPREKAYARLAAWLASSACPDLETPPEWLPESEHANYFRNQRWQAAYRQAIAEGKAAHEAHYHACNAT